MHALAEHSKQPQLVNEIKEEYNLSEVKNIREAMLSFWGKSSFKFA
jgi:hypothetical protein